MDIPYFDDMELLAADVDPRSRGRVHRQRWPGVFNLQLFLPDRGPLLFQRDDEPPQRFESPRCYWHDPRHRYSFGPVEREGCWHHCWMSLRGRRAERLIRRGFDRLAEAGHCSVARPADAYDCFKRACQTDRAAGGITLIAEELLLLCSEQRAPHALDALIARIQQDPCREIDSAAEAAAMGCSVGHFRRRFRQRCGQALHDFVLDQRMRLAARLLVSRRDDIAVIAAELGYGNASQFSKLFRSRFQRSPRAFRHGLPRA